MNSELIFIYIIQGVILITITFVGIYLKKLPETLQEKTLKKFQHSLNEKLELLKITQGELQVHKRNEYIRFNEYWRKMMHNKNVRKDLNQVGEINSIGLNFFYFASDDVVKKFVELRKHLLYSDLSIDDNNKKTMKLMAELNLLMRIDLGYIDTKCTEDDYLNILLKDWELVKDTY